MPDSLQRVLMASHMLEWAWGHARLRGSILCTWSKGECRTHGWDAARHTGRCSLALHGRCALPPPALLIIGAVLWLQAGITAAAEAEEQLARNLEKKVADEEAKQEQQEAEEREGGSKKLEGHKPKVGRARDCTLC